MRKGEEFGGVGMEKGAGHLERRSVMEGMVRREGSCRGM